MRIHLGQLTFVPSENSYVGEASSLGIRPDDLPMLPNRRPVLHTGDSPDESVRQFLFSGFDRNGRDVAGFRYVELDSRGHVDASGVGLLIIND